MIEKEHLQKLKGYCPHAMSSKMIGEVREVHVVDEKVEIVYSSEKAAAGMEFSPPLCRKLTRYAREQYNKMCPSKEPEIGCPMAARLMGGLCPVYAMMDAQAWKRLLLYSNARPGRWIKPLAQ